MIYNENLKTKVCNSCTIYIVLFVTFLIRSISISSILIFFHLYLKKDDIYFKFNINIQATFY